MTLMHEDTAYTAYRGVPWAEAPLFYASSECLENYVMAEGDAAKQIAYAELRSALWRKLFPKPDRGQPAQLVVYGRFYSSAHTLQNVRPEFLMDDQGNSLVDEKTGRLLLGLEGQPCAEGLLVCPGAAWARATNGPEPNDTYMPDLVSQLRLWGDARERSLIWNDGAKDLRQQSLNAALTMLREGRVRLEGSEFTPDVLELFDFKPLPSDLLLSVLNSYLEGPPRDLYAMLLHHLGGWGSLRLLPVYLADPEETEVDARLLPRFKSHPEDAGLSWLQTYSNLVNVELWHQLDDLEEAFWKLRHRYSGALPLWVDLDNKQFTSPPWQRLSAGVREPTVRGERILSDLNRVYLDFDPVEVDWASQFNAEWIELEKKRDGIWKQLERELLSLLDRGVLESWAYLEDYADPRSLSSEDLKEAQLARDPSEDPLQDGDDDDWYLSDGTLAKQIRFRLTEKAKATRRGRRKGDTKERVESITRRLSSVLANMLETRPEVRTMTLQSITQELLLEHKEFGEYWAPSTFEKKVSDLLKREPAQKTWEPQDKDAGKDIERDKGRANEDSQLPGASSATGSAKP
ncbi:hypothetical protein [Fodinicurvata sediminis]|uniref:hypothetical protein n=1 Tax=Fodinicurvata sediminis TaxID=1121832 RepID=UPI00040B9D8F|nr:hypothetical protein [Fodinicurvata sediminis]